MPENYKMLAKTLYGLEEVLARELLQLGAQDIKIGTRNVSFVGDLGFMYKANLGLRTALRILVPIHDFYAHNEEEFYKKVKSFEWEKWLDQDGSFAISSTINSKTFTHSKFMALKTKDAIVDRFRERSGERPQVDLKFPDIQIHLHIDRNKCNLSLDSSGESLHKRGYKTSTNIAPINEVLAAGMILLSGWNGNANFMDPMCGSGTILVEAAMIACQIPPNLKRKEFGFERWKNWDAELYDLIEESLLKKAKEFPYKIIGYDKAPSAIRKARENVKNADLQDFIDIEQTDFFKTKKTVEGPLHMVFNPPYGERLNIDFEKFYAEIGNTLKQGYPGTEAWFISSNMEALKHVGLRPSRKIKLFNGKLESRLLKYELYAGSRKAKHQTK